MTETFAVILIWAGVFLIGAFAVNSFLNKPSKRRRNQWGNE